MTAPDPTRARLLRIARCYVDAPERSSERDQLRDALLFTCAAHRYDWISLVGDVRRLPPPERRIADLEAALLDAYAWFEEVHGHDGAPDGGDPAWVTDAEEAIGRGETQYGPDWSEIVQARLAARATTGIAQLHDTVDWEAKAIRDTQARLRERGS